jgi:hypothetical protein
LSRHVRKSKINKFFFGRIPQQKIGINYLRIKSPSLRGRSLKERGYLEEVFK